MSLVTTENSYDSASVTPAYAQPRPLSWGAILAGAVAALSVHLLITLFAIGLGVQLIDPVGDPDPGKKFSVGVGIAWSVSALLALWIGGWVAGRLAPKPNRHLGRLHGVLVWSVATVVMAFSLTSTTGALLGGVAKLTGKGLAVAGQAGGQAVKGSGDFVSKIVDKNSDLLGGFVNELSPPAGNGQNTAARPPLDAKGTREISWALLSFFSQDQGERPAAARQALVKAVADNTGMSEADANKRVDEWVASYEQVQRDLKQLADQAERKAREAAKVAADYVTQVAIWTFIAFVVGAIAGAWGGSSGAKCRRETDVAASEV